MAQPYEIYGPRVGGHGFSRRPIVLARLPHICIEAETAGSPPSGQPITAPEVQSPGGSHFYIDQRHVMDVPPEIAVERPQGGPSETEPHTQRHRHHHGPHHQRQSPQSTTKKENQAGMAGGLFRLHGELASYSGLIATLVLAASAILMYLTIVVPNQKPNADYNNRFESYGSAPVEIPKFGVQSSAPVEPQIASTSPPLDPFETSSEKVSAAAEEPVLSDKPAYTWDDAFHATQDQAASELSTIATESVPELIPTPEQTIESVEEPALPLNDASASAYPATEHPQLDLAKLGVMEISGELEEDTKEPTIEQPATNEPTTNEPTMAQRPEPPTPLPINR